jgi:hypothetical protein
MTPTEQPSLNELVSEVHRLWDQVACTDDPTARKLRFEQITHVEKLTTAQRGKSHG